MFFWQNQSTTWQILTIHQIIKGVKTKNLKVTLLFIDFSKAFTPFAEDRCCKYYKHSLPKETVTTMMILYKSPKATVHSQNSNTDFFNIITGVFQGDTMYVYNLPRLHTSNVHRSNNRKWLHTKKGKSRWCPEETMTVADNTDDLVLLANTSGQAKSQQHSLEKEPGGWASMKTQIKQSPWVLNKKEISAL